MLAADWKLRRCAGMIAIPALHVSDGHVVLLDGSESAGTGGSIPEPLGVAQQWVESGFAALHLIDVDAALDQGSNAAVVHAILRNVEAAVQVGGGVRNDAAVDALLAAGAARVIVGTRGIDDPDWLRRTAERHPGRIMLAADARAGMVVTHGWAQESGVAAVDLLVGLDDLPLAGVLVTDVERDDGANGADVVFFESLVNACAHPLFAAGGITGEADLAALAGAGVAGAILGTALYRGTLDAPTIARSYRE